MTMTMSLSQLVCIGMMSGGLGAFMGLFLLAWLDERDDKYAGIKWSPQWEPSPYRFP
jgi:hypothetical protein